MKAWLGALLLGASLHLTAPVIAQGLPQGPIRIVAGFAAGGSSDSMARLIADRMKETLGRTFIIENVAGAGGRAAAEQVRNAPPDGTRILLGNTVMMSLAPVIFNDLRYDPIADFMPVAKAADYQIVLATGTLTGARTVAELTSWLKGKPEQASYGVPAAGSLPHLYALQIASSTKFSMTMVPFRGGALIAQALAGGHVAMGLSAFSDFSEQHRGGLLRIVAQSGSRRHPAFGDIPTFAESGVLGADENGWNGFFLVKGTPPEIAAAYAEAIRAALTDQTTAKRLEDLGFLVAYSTGSELSRQIVAEQAKWRPIINAAGLAQKNP